MGADTYPVIDLAATGRNICDLRKARGLTVADLQEYFGFEAPQAIYKWQAGKSLPSTDNLFALSHLLGVPIDEILIPIKPRLKSLPQEDSCGVDSFLGVLYRPIIYFILFNRSFSNFFNTSKSSRSVGAKLFCILLFSIPVLLP